MLRVTLLLTTFLVYISHVQAALVFSLQDDGLGNLVLTTSGQVDSLAGMIHTSQGLNGTSNISPGQGIFVTGATGNPYDRHVGITGPVGLSAVGSIGVADITAGPFTGVEGFFQVLYLPFNYVLGTPISNSSTWIATTFTSLGITPGSYTWTWGGIAGDSATLYAGVPVPSAIPEPSTWIALAGFAGLGLLLWRRRRVKAARDMKATGLADIQ